MRSTRQLILVLSFALITFTIGAQVKSFVAYSMGTKAELKWEAISEKQNDYFIIERSTDAKTWKEIGQVNSSEKKLTAQKYDFTDKGPLNGQFYYRLSHTISGAQTITSAPVSIQSFSLSNVFEIIPSETVKNNYTIVSDANTDLTITNENGAVVKTILLSESNNYQYALKDLSTGIYLLTGSNYNGTLRNKIAIHADN